jgi:hypothetical protein
MFICSGQKMYNVQLSQEEPIWQLASNKVTPAENQRLLLAVGVLREWCYGNAVQDIVLLHKMSHFRGRTMLGKLPSGFPPMTIEALTALNI